MAFVGKDSTELALPTLTVEELTNISDFESAMRLLQAREISLITEMPAPGDGFLDYTQKKNELVGVPMLLVFWDFRDGDIEPDEGESNDGPREYVGVRAVTQDNRKVYFASGETLGVYGQLKRATEETGQTSGIVARFGLDYITIKSRHNKRSYRLATEPMSV